MGLLSKEGLLTASDLIERDVDLPALGGSVRVRSLPAAYSNQAMSDALEVVTDQRGRQTAKVNTAKLEAIQVLHGLIEPKLESLEEVNLFALRCGSSWRQVVGAIDEISGIDKEAIEKTTTTFPAGGRREERPVVGNGHTAAPGVGGPDLHVRAGVAAGDAGRGDVLADDGA